MEPIEFHTGSLDKPDHLQQALSYLTAHIIGIQFITYGLLLEASTLESAQRIARLKHRTVHKPLTVILPDLTLLVPLIDFDRVHPDFHPVLRDPRQLELRLASRSLLRIPIGPAAHINHIPLHPGIADLEHHTLQIFYLGDRHPLGQSFIADAYEQPHLKVLAVSSMNHSGDHTILSLTNAKHFCHRHGLPYLLTDPLAKNISPPHRGSYPILSINQHGLQLIREGNHGSREIFSLWPEHHSS